MSSADNLSKNYANINACLPVSSADNLSENYAYFNACLPVSSTDYLPEKYAHFNACLLITFKKTTPFFTLVFQCRLLITFLKTTPALTLVFQCRLLITFPKTTPTLMLVFQCHLLITFPKTTPTLCLKGCCTGSSESTLVEIPHCYKCFSIYCQTLFRVLSAGVHVAAHIEKVQRMAKHEWHLGHVWSLLQWPNLEAGRGQSRLAPIVKLNYAYWKVFFHWFLNLMMAEFVLRAEREDNSDGKTMFGLFLLVRTSLLN